MMLRVLTLLAAFVLSGSATAQPQPDCDSADGILDALAGVGHKLDELAKAQRAQSTDLVEFVAEKARESQWTDMHRGAIQQGFLASARYIALQGQREPHAKVLQEFKSELRAVDTIEKGHAACLKIGIVLIAADQSFKINTMQYQLAKQFFSTAE